MASIWEFERVWGRVEEDLPLTTSNACYMSVPSTLPLITGLTFLGALFIMFSAVCISLPILFLKKNFNRQINNCIYFYNKIWCFHTCIHYRVKRMNMPITYQHVAAGGSWDSENVKNIFSLSCKNAFCNPSSSALSLSPCFHHFKKLQYTLGLTVDRLLSLSDIVKIPCVLLGRGSALFDLSSFSAF